MNPTPEQQQRADEIYEKYFQIGSSTEPCDRPAVERLWKQWYAEQGHAEPRFEWVLSFEAARELDPDLRPAWWGSIVDGPWGAYYELCDDLKLIDYTPEQRKELKDFIEFLVAAFVCWTYVGVVMCCERPAEIHWDDEENLHNDTGPSVVFRDGSSYFHVHGVQVPAKVILAPETITLDEINSENNAEVKRISIEKYGWERWMADSNAEVLDMDSVPIESWNEAAGSITRALVQTDLGRFLIACDGSTERTYSMRAPDKAKTAEEAYKAITGAETSKCLAQG